MSSSLPSHPNLEEILDTTGLPDVVPNGGSILAFARTTKAIDRLLTLGECMKVAEYPPAEQT